MSAARATAVRADRSTAPTRAAGRPAPTSAPAPRLRVVRAPAHARTHLPFVLLCMAVLACALLGALLLNTTMAQGEYNRQSLQARLSDSTQNLQSIEAQLQRATSPDALAASARALGMVLVPASQGGYLRLSDGAVLGNPTPAGGAG